MTEILVIDDNTDCQKIIKEFLELRHYKVTVASDGIIALNYLNQRKFDLVICDIIMPNKDGIEVIGFIQKSHNKTPVIAISGGGKMNSAEMALKYAKHYPVVRNILEKPFSHTELYSVVSNTLKS